MAEAPKTEEAVKNCPACKKPLRKSRRYYRNGGYFCNKNCFNKVAEKAAAEKADAAAAAEAGEAKE